MRENRSLSEKYSPSVSMRQNPIRAWRSCSQRTAMPQLFPAPDCAMMQVRPVTTSWASTVMSRSPAFPIASSI